MHFVSKFPASLQSICSEYHKKIARLEADKYDIELAMVFRAFEVKIINADLNYSASMKSALSANVLLLRILCFYCFVIYKHVLNCKTTDIYVQQ